VVTLDRPDRSIGDPVAVAAGIVASSVRDSNPSKSNQRKRDFRPSLSRASRRLRRPRLREWMLDDPVRMNWSPLSLKYRWHRENCEVSLVCVGCVDQEGQIKCGKWRKHTGITDSVSTRFERDLWSGHRAERQSARSIGVPWTVAGLHMRTAPACSRRNDG